MKGFLAACALALLAGGCATTGGEERDPRDPFEGFNRGVYRFNEGFDEYVAKPVARGYVAVVHQEIRGRVGNFFSNIGDLLIGINNFLQFKFEDGVNDWARFAANAKQSKGEAGVGNCHYSPNGEADYDYGNRRFVESSADDWLNYPDLKGTKKKLNCEAWGGPDYHRNYMKWWFARLPRAAGVNAKNERLNNWWEYVFHFNAYDDRGKPLRR